jgi:hypothetical protein
MWPRHSLETQPRSKSQNGGQTKKLLACRLVARTVGAGNFIKVRLPQGYGATVRALLDEASVDWARQDSNLGPRDYESPALTAELQARMREKVKHSEQRITKRERCKRNMHWFETRFGFVGACSARFVNGPALLKASPAFQLAESYI